MKNKFLNILLMLTLVFSLVGCSSNSTDNANNANNANNSSNVAEEVNIESTNIRIGALKGPTSIGMVKLFSDSDNGIEQVNTYEYDIVASADEIVAGLTKGDYDVAAIPANLAAVLYNKTEGELLKVADINTLGVLYVASREEITDISDLAGRTIVMSGKGSTPEFSFRKILMENGIDPDTDVTLDFKSEHEEVLSTLVADETAIAVLPQPFLTAAELKVEDLTVNFSLNELWEEFSGEPLVTGVLVVRNEFLEAYPENFDAFLAEYKASVEYVNANVDEAAALVGSYDIVTEAVAKIAIPKCNIVYIDGEEMQTALSYYLNILFEADASSVGGSMPDENFYYK